MIKLIFIFWLSAIILPNIVCAQVKIQLLDQDKKPVSKAVISIPSENVSNNVAEIAIMDQVNRQFSPHVLVVTQGQSILFPNSDDIRHHVYSFSEPKPFEIKLYRGTPTAPDLFDKPGIVILGCNVHDHMVGYIYVADNKMAGVTDEKGMAVFEIKAPEEVKIWHSRLSESADESISMPLIKQNDEGVWQLTINLRPLVVKAPRKFKARFN